MTGGRKRLLRASAVALVVAGFAFEIWTPVLAGGVLYALALVVWAASRPTAGSLVALAGALTAMLGLGPAVHGEVTDAMIGEHVTVIATTWLVTALLLARSRQAARISQAQSEGQLYLDVAGVIVVALDTEGRITKLNRAGCELLGVTEEEVLGESWMDRFVPSEERPFVRDVHRGAMSTGAPADPVENAVQAVDGTKRRVLWRNTVLRASDGTVTGSLSSGMDVTELRLAERELERARERLRERESLARLGEMAAVVAHEVKNPLAGLSSTLQILERRAGAEPEDRRIVRAMIDRLHGLDRIVDELLSFARPPQMERAPLDPADLLRRVAQSAPEGVQLHLEGPEGGSCTVEGDAAQLERALLNLVLNAVHASSKEPGSVSLHMRRRDDGCEVRVEDDGPGVAEEVRARAFEPFVTTKSHGTGLGLAVTRRIVQAHGGTVSLDDRPEGGTVAIVRLPLMDPQSSESRSARSTST